MMTPVATLVLHIVFGLVLGGVYGLLPLSGARSQLRRGSRTMTQE